MKRKVGVMVLGIFSILAVSLSLQAAEFVNPQYLIETKDLMAKMGQPDLVIVDVRIPEAYELGHIKGAINISVKLTQGTVKGVKEMMLPVADLEKLLSSKGISPDSYVVLHDENVQDFSTLFFWTLNMLGHKKMAVLNGGYQNGQRKVCPYLRKRPSFLQQNILPSTIPLNWQPLRM
ncbi:MAG: rhodanese-like domain-containing protein [Thermodesulfobacteriota bacterium]